MSQAVSRCGINTILILHLALVEKVGGITHNLAAVAKKPAAYSQTMIS